MQRRSLVRVRANSHIRNFTARCKSGRDDMHAAQCWRVVVGIDGRKRERPVPETVCAVPIRVVCFDSRCCFAAGAGIGSLLVGRNVVPVREPKDHIRIFKPVGIRKSSCLQSPQLTRGNGLEEFPCAPRIGLVETGLSRRIDCSESVELWIHRFLESIL